MKNRILISFIILGFVLVLTTSAFAWGEVKKAKEFIEAGMFPQAIELLNKRITDKPTDAEAHFLLGTCYMKTKNFREADNQFDSAIGLFSKNKDEIVFWTAVGASGTIGAAIGVILGVLVAWSQLKQLSRSIDSEAIMRVYEIFDTETQRENRREIINKLRKIPPADLNRDGWTIIGRTATEMDVVGTMLKHKQIKCDLIFERYCEVIMPLWIDIKPHIEYRRAQMGGFSWTNFEFMAKKAKKWSEKERGISEYPRYSS